MRAAGWLEGQWSSDGRRAAEAQTGGCGAAHHRPPRPSGAGASCWYSWATACRAAGTASPVNRYPPSRRATSGLGVENLELADQPPGGLKAGKDRVQLSARVAGLLHQVVAVPWLGRVVEQGSKYDGDGRGRGVVRTTDEPVPGRGGPRWIALRDRPYLLLTGLDGVMAIQFKVLTVAIPLWLVSAASAPRWPISATMLTSTAIVVSQVRASRAITSSDAGGRAYRRTGVAFSGLVLPHLVGRRVPVWLAVTVLLAGFEVSFALAPGHATGQYLGVFGLGAGLAETVGPGLPSRCASRGGVPGGVWSGPCSSSPGW